MGELGLAPADFADNTDFNERYGLYVLVILPQGRISADFVSGSVEMNASIHIAPRFPVVIFRLFALPKEL